MSSLTIADRSAELIFDMTSWEAMEEQVGVLDGFDELMTGKERLKNMRRCVAILSKEGARLKRGAEMPADWLKENMSPGDVRKLGPAIRAAITAGMAMETSATEGGDQVVDEVLAEIEKKEARDA